MVVRPNFDEFHNNFADSRRAYNAIAAADALAAHLYVWAKTNAPNKVATAGDDSAFRAVLANRDHNFSLLRDIAKALKHVRLTKGSPQVNSASQVVSRPIGYGEGGFGAGRYGGPEQVIVDIPQNGIRYIEEIVDQAVAFLEAEMTDMGA